MNQGELIQFFHRKMIENYTSSQLTAEDSETFRRHIQSLEGTIDYASENYQPYEKERQRDLSIKFHWGHDHDFGTFTMQGRMRDRHIRLMADFCTLFDLDPKIFYQKNVLDVGSWTGGTALLLETLGAHVDTIEEVTKYAETTRYLVRSFGKEARIDVHNVSLYECDDPAWQDKFDVVYFPGVLYHLSDPVLALRILYNALRIGGTILVETMGYDSEEPLCIYEGSQVFGAGEAESLNRGGWNWFVPSALALERMLYAAGFDAIRTVYSDNRKRIYAYAEKTRMVGITKAGLAKKTIR